MQKTSLLLFLIPLSTLCLGHPAQARLNTFTGGVTVGYDYDKTNYKRDDIENALPDQNDTQQQFSIGPLFIFESTSSRDGVTINYNPSFVYTIEDSESDVDQSVFLSAYRDFTSRFRVDLSESYVYSDDPELLDADTSSDYNRGRRQYWTNDFNINGTYAYGLESSFGAGYTYRIMRNDDTGPGGYENYDRHIGDLSLQHRINSDWNVSLFTSYTRGTFDPPDSEIAGRIGDGLEEIVPGITDGINFDDLSNDLSEYRAGGTLNWLFSSRNTFLVSYDFSASNYDALLRNDTSLHNVTFGTEYQHTRKLSFELGVGPSYEKTETFDANWGYNGHANLNYDLAERSTISAGVEKNYDQENFSSNNNVLGREQGITKYWDFSADLSHEIITDLTATLFGSYRDEKQLNILHGFVNAIEADADLADIDRETFREESVFKRDIYEAGGSLGYTFLQWYTAAFNYTYRHQDSQILNDSYDEHRVFLTLSFQKELARW